MGYTLDDLKGISPTICQHLISYILYLLIGGTVEASTLTLMQLTKLTVQSYYESSLAVSYA
jgi:hypothetical protein